ncbi:MAG: nuclear transport factor 2 family protein [Bryobacteraceae bacterium]|nr:nuclear transport factor 2 family protein [Bryobacteraceae bacterium]
MSEDAIATTLIEMERQALNRWARGDPDGFLAISSPDVSYFDPFVEKRLDGLDALRALYEQLRGKVRIDHFAMLAPRVQAVGNAAILTFQFESSGSAGPKLWNTTEVYRQTAGGWRIVHTHWALNRPQPPAAGV